MRKLFLLALHLYLCQAASAQLSVHFSTDVAGGCSPLVVHFSNQTTGASPTAQYQWDLGNGNSSAQTNPVAVYTQPGSYTIRLTVRDGSLTGTFSQTIVVDQPSTASFTASDTRVCAPAPIQFTSTSTAGGSAIASYLWDFGDGSTQSGSGPSMTHSYQTAGTESVSLTVTDGYGCSATATQAGLLTILPRMDVAFTEDKNVVCALGDPVQFTNSSAGPGTLTYGWRFGDGGTSTQASPSYTYAAKGTYTIGLTVTSSLGCTETVTQSNVVNVDNFQAAFTVPSSVCVGTLTLIADQSSPAPSRWEWLVDGAPMQVPGYPPVYYGFPAPGPHIVTLDAFFGSCEEKINKLVKVNPLPVLPPFDQTVQGPCGGPGVSFLDHTPGAVKWAWLFGYVAYEQPTDTVFGGPGNSTNYPSGSYQTQLTVTDANGCRASESEYITVAPPYYTVNETDGKADTVCGGSLTKSYAFALPAMIKSASWNFGDGTSSTSMTPTHTFATPGTYNVTVNWTDVNGCTGTTSMSRITVSPLLNFDFAAEEQTICAGQNVVFHEINFNDQSATAIWSFGDGEESTGVPDAVHLYQTPGVYDVSLYIQSVGGCVKTVVKKSWITVNPIPLLGLSYTYDCSGDWGTLTFHISATNATQLTWHFGDGTKDTVTDGTVTEVAHHYARSGASYPVTVIATNGTCTNTAVITGYVIRKPQSVNLSVNPSTVCANEYGNVTSGTVTATVVVTADEPANSITYFWADDMQYGDGTHFTYQSPNDASSGNTQTYTWNLSFFQLGKSGLRVILQTITGCADTTNTVPMAIGGPNPGYLVQDHQCFQQAVVFEDTTASPAADPIVSWSWDFGDGSTSAQPRTVSHPYANPGNYPARLTVQDAVGCTATSNSAAQVVVNGPKAQFVVTGGPPFVPGSTVSFYNTSYGDPATTPYSWDFGDFSPPSTAAYPTHVYSAPGVYNVVLTAKDPAGGCVSTYTQQVVVEGVNTAFSKTGAYVSSGSCPPVLVQFQNQSVNYASLTWDFGDGVVVTDVPNPSHVYASPGTYIVQLTAIDLTGKSTTTVDSVIVLAPSSTLAAAVPAICVGQSDTLRATTGQRVKRYNWDFGDGTLTSGSDSVAAHVFNTPGNYVAQLVVTDSLGCSAAGANSDRISVHAPPLVALTPPQARVCLGSSVQLSAALSGGSIFSWSPGTGLSDVHSGTPTASPVLNTVYTVTVTDAIGCSDSGSIPVSIVLPETVQVQPDSAAICMGKEVGLQATGADGYQWIGAVDGLSATNVGGVTARPVVTTVYHVVGGDQYGCFTDTLAVPVTVLLQPAVDAGPDIQVIAETPVTIPAVGGGAAIVAWQWAPPADLSCTDCQQPVCSPRSDHQYVVTVTAADGCVASDTVVVDLICDEAKVRIPDAFTPNGDGHNDRWTILGAVSIVDHLAIYDRWGARVFEADHFFPADPKSGWDGTIGNQLAPAGVYAYFVQMRCPTGGVFARQGTLVLVR